MQIIGLGHTSRCGKDTLANAIIKNLERTGLRAVKRPFAWKLKEICHDLYAWDGMREPEFYDTPEGEPYRDIKLPTIGLTPVEVWVKFGTPAVREQVYQKTWIDYLLKGTKDVDVLIVPDVRFPNEVEALREVDATLVKVVRPGYGPRKTVADRALVGYTGWDWVVGSVGTMDSLHQWGRFFTDLLTEDKDFYQPQSEADKIKACSVEVIEPWEPLVAGKTIDLRLTEDQIEGLKDILASYESEEFADVADCIYEKLVVA
jgi:hypothetical protein